MPRKALLTAAEPAPEAAKVPIGPARSPICPSRTFASSVSRTLDDFPKKKAFVLVFTNTSCPLARRYFRPCAATTDKDYRDQGVQFLAVNAGDEDPITAMAAQAVEYRWSSLS